jgi:hypothetical protein
MCYKVNGTVRRRTFCATADLQHVNLCINFASTLKVMLSCDSLSLSWTAWPHDGMNSTVWYAKQHIMAQICHAVNSMARRRTLCASAEQQHVHLCIHIANMLRSDV